METDLVFLTGFYLGATGGGMDGLHAIVDADIDMGVQQFFVFGKGGIDAEQAIDFGAVVAGFIERLISGGDRFI